MRLIVARPNRQDLAALPLASLLVLYAGAEYRYELQPDPWDVTFHGFPVPWNSDSLATSLAKVLYCGPLLIDFLFYLAVAFIVIRTLGRLPVAPEVASAFRRVTLVLSAASLALGALLFSWEFSLWPAFGQLRFVSARFGIGL